MRSRSRVVGALLIGLTLGGAARAQEAGVPSASPALPASSPPAAPLPAPPVREVIDYEIPGSRVHPDPPVPARPRYIRRAYARSAMLVSYFLPGVYSDFGGERTPSGGLWAGGGLSISNSPLPIAYVPNFRVHMTLGYSGRYFALGGDLGGGAGYSWLGIGSIDLGVALRFGRIDGVHANLLLYWWLFPTDYPFPMGGEFSLLAPLRSGSWFHWELRGDARLGPWGSCTFGARHLISDEPKGSTFVTWGVGASWQFPYPGVLIQAGYEYRH